MTNESRPLLTFGPAIVGERPKRPGRGRSNLVKPNPGRQTTRIEPQFRKLVSAFEAQRAKMGVGIPDEVDPNLVIVFDLAGSVKDFCNAINRIEGLEFLSEFIGDDTEPDDDFYTKDKEGCKTDAPVLHSLYLAMSNMAAIEELLQLFEKWKSDPKVTLDWGLSKFKEMFQQLVAIRHWGPQDRIQETGLYEEWKERLEVIGNSQSFVQVEVELWYRQDKIKQIKAEEIVRNNVSNVAGKVISRALIPEINYHALLVELPIQQVELFLAEGAESVQLLTVDEIMFVSPYRPMALGWQDNDSIADDDLIRGIALNEGERVQGKPRVALLDGLPVSNHGALRGRLIIDDPDDLEDHYPVIKRQHGTEMASLIIHGDLNEPDAPLDRPLYVRPIMESVEGIGCAEQVISNVLFPDLLIRTVRRIIEGDGDSEAVAPSVRIINLSIGDPARVLIRRMSPGGRVLDWLAVNYNLLFIVSAGNHNEIPITIPIEDASNIESARTAAVQATFNNSLLLGILSPGDAINALTIGATHNDKADAIDVPDTVLDITRANFPAHYSGRGPGINRSIKPDLYYMGGRVVYERPVITSEQQGNIEIAKESLGILIGVSNPSSIEIVPFGVEDNFTKTIDLSKDMEKLTTQNTEYKIAQKQIDISRKNTKLEKSSFHPTINGTLRYGTLQSQGKLKNVFETKNLSSAAGVTFTWDIFDWGKRKEDVSYAQKTEEIAEVKSGQTLDQVKANMRKTYYQLQALEKSLEALKVAVESAEETYELEKERYSYNLITMQRQN